MTFAYHYRLEKCLSHLIIILQNMAFVYELQEDFSRCFESIKLSFWIASGYFDPEDELSKSIYETYKIFSDKVKK